MRIVKGLVGLAVTEDTVARNRALQAEWYGEPLGDRIRPLLDRLGMSQSGLAGVLGLSAPMLSQLMSGRRAKISNPAVLHRLMAVEELVADPGFDGMASAEIKRRLDEIKAEAPATTSGLRRTGHSGAEGGGDGMSGGRAPGGHGAAGGEGPSGEGAAGPGPAERPVSSRPSCGRSPPPPR